MSMPIKDKDKPFTEARMKGEKLEILYVDTWKKYKSDRKFYKEKNDCTVRAFAEAFNTSYDKAHKHLKFKMGRINRKGIESRFEKSIQYHKITCLEFKGRDRSGHKKIENSITLSKFCEEYNRGNYIVLVRGHALAVKDGIIYDHKHSPRRQVKFAFRVERL